MTTKKEQVILEGVVVPFVPGKVRFTFDIQCDDGQRYFCFALPGAPELPEVGTGQRVRVYGVWSEALARVFETTRLEIIDEKKRK
ncbi:MAG TPA: hypothetical protein VGN52_13315 [Burkholderiales bacterium]|jgi:hypothetical protein